MQINRIVPSFYNNFAQPPAQGSSMPGQIQNAGYHAPGVIVDISEAYKQSKANAEKGEIAGINDIDSINGCQTCKSRRYVDQSNDSSVSYQTPQHISPEASASKVMAHEREHVTNEQARADREDRRVISQTVSLSTSICPECGKIYVSGGTARTVTGNKEKNDEQLANAANGEQGESRGAEL